MSAGILKILPFNTKPLENIWLLYLSIPQEFLDFSKIYRLQKDENQS